MKLGIFVDHFPVPSQTFVLNQVTGLIDLGVDVTVVALNPPAKGANHSAKGSACIWEDYGHLEAYRLQSRTIYLNQQDVSTSGRLVTLVRRVSCTLQGLLSPARWSRTLKALRLWRYGHHGKSLLLASVAGQVSQPLCFDVILCHFGFNGVLAHKLRDVGVLQGVIATIFHGYEISATLALDKYEQDYRSVFVHTALMLPVNELWQQRLLELGCPEEKIQVQRMGVDLSLFTFNTAHVIGPKLRLFSVARFTEKKGLEYGLRALALLGDKIDFHYCLAGYGERAESLALLVRELKLDQKVSFLGPLDQRQVIEQMQGADIFLQPSITADNGDMEGVPVAIMEAMAIGAVVVSTLHSGIPELIIHGEHGLLSAERDVLSLAENISLLYQDPALYAGLREKARQRVEQMASVATLNQQLLERLKQLLPLV